MKKLVVHHTYDTAVPFDVSRTGNHGIATSAIPNRAGSYRFRGGPSRVVIPVSSSLENLRSVRVCCRFRLDPKAVSGRRYNLVEGDMSFALFIQRDRGLQATIYDRDGTWQGPRSGKDTIKAGRWHTADYRHDGISHARLFLDGVLVDERFDVPGPVRTPGNHGIVVGAWPAPDNRFTLYGLVDDVMIYKHDPSDPLPLVDECCVDRAAVDALATSVLDAGWDHERVDATMREVLDLGTRASISARAGSAARTTRLSDLTKRGVLAVGMRDTASLAGVIGQIQDMVREKVGDAEIASMAEQAYGAFARLPIFEGEDPEDYLREHLHDWARMLCLDDMLPPRPKPPPRKPRGEPEGDPDTDRPDGKPLPGWEKDPDDKPDPESPAPGRDRPRQGRPPLKPPRRPGGDD